jgi:hypothetical protein
MMYTTLHGTQAKFGPGTGKKSHSATVVLLSHTSTSDTVTVTDGTAVSLVLGWEKCGSVAHKLT